MKSIKTGWKIVIVLALLLLITWILLLLILPKRMGPIQPFINIADVFTRRDEAMPNKPVYYQTGVDCITGDLVIPGELIQPIVGCDNWRANRFERPFNAISQDEYHPDLDIKYAHFGRDVDWYYLHLALFDAQPGTEFLSGTYAIEMDLDDDGRGDIIVLVSEPGKGSGDDWSTQGVQIWVDANNDVGGDKPNLPEVGVVSDGYDTLLYDQGNGDELNSAWARAFMSRSTYVELAFRTTYLDGDLSFKWQVWSWAEGDAPDLFELHDIYSHEQTGDTNKEMEFFPIKEVFALDNSCAFMWGAIPNPDDPDFCFNEPFTSDGLEEPTDDTCCLLKCLACLFPCKIPKIPPGEGPCVLPFEEWVLSVWQPDHPGETPSDDVLWPEYDMYLMDPYCPPTGLVTRTPTPTATDTLTPTPTNTLTPTPTPTATPNPCDYDCKCEPLQGETSANCPDCLNRCGNGICDCGETSYTCPEDCGKPPPEVPVCNQNMEQRECEASGGTYVVLPGAPSYCSCP